MANKTIHLAEGNQPKNCKRASSPLGRGLGEPTEGASLGSGASEPDETSTSSDEVDASYLESLLLKAKASAPYTHHGQASCGAKAFSNGRFKDPIGDLVKANLYIQSISPSSCTEQAHPNSSKFAPVKFVKFFGEGELGLSKEASTLLSDPNLSQALAIHKLKGTQELKMNFDLVQKPSKAERAKLKESNAGGKWFNMPAAVMTPELKLDLELLSLRNVLDKKRFYKKLDRPFSKFLQVGTIIEDKSEFYSSRLPKKQRQSTLVGEVLNDAEAQEYLESRYKKSMQPTPHNARTPSQLRFKGRFKRK